MKDQIVKIRQNEIEDIFSYRDEFNEEHIIKFPRSMKMTIEDVFEWLND